MKLGELGGDPSLGVRVQDFASLESPARVARLDPTGIVVVVAVGRDAVLAEQQERVPLSGEIEDGVLLAGEMPIEHGRRVGVRRGS